MGKHTDPIPVDRRDLPSIHLAEIQQVLDSRLLDPQEKLTAIRAHVEAGDLSISYAGEADESFRHAIDAMQGYTVRLDVAGHGSIDVELIGSYYDEDDEDDDEGLTADDLNRLAFYPTDPDGGQLGLDDPRRVRQSVPLIQVEHVHVY